MTDFISFLPLIIVVVIATVLKSMLHKEMRKLTQPQMLVWSREFMTQRMWQFGGIILVLVLVMLVSSGKADKSTAMILLGAAGLLILIGFPISMYLTQKKIKSLALPDSFLRAVMIDKGTQGVLLGMFIYYGTRYAEVMQS
ncbi:MAG: hypothetical protein K8S54_17375 [Spirochaetia bacterium]|nr:hypothetical protein [Spirochaetia bacterium]